MTMACICCKLVFGFSATLAIINFSDGTRFCHERQITIRSSCLDVILCFLSDSVKWKMLPSDGSKAVFSVGNRNGKIGRIASALNKV